MNKLLVFLGSICLLVGGLFIVNNFFPSSLLFIPSFFFSSIFLSIIIIATGFIRFDKIIGVLIFIIGGISLLSDLILPWRIIPLSLLPWVLIAIGGRFLFIGILSGENIA